MRPYLNRLIAVAGLLLGILGLAKRCLCLQVDASEPLCPLELADLRRLDLCSGVGQVRSSPLAVSSDPMKPLLRCDRETLNTPWPQVLMLDNASHLDFNS
jgi:hypothetical protein